MSIIIPQIVMRLPVCARGWDLGLIVVFSPDQFGKVVPWLMLNREGLDVLVHPETGDNVIDHLDHALWLGKKLKLNIGTFK